MRILFLFMGVLFLCSCKQQKTEIAEESSAGQDLQNMELPARIPLHPLAAKEILEWPEFREFDTSFSRLDGVENKEDLILVVEDLIAKHQELAASSPPDQLNTSQIKSRMVVVLTNLHLIKSKIHYNVAWEETVINTVVAYNALRAQMNIQVTNTLDTKTIIDD